MATKCEEKLFHETIKPSQAQLRYACILQKATLIGSILLIGGYFVYLLDFLPSYVSVSNIHQFWGLNLQDYISQSGIPLNWGWVSSLNHGDMISYIGIAFLTGVSIICLAAIVPVFLKAKDKNYVVIVVVQIFVFLLAASGFISGGH